MPKTNIEQLNKKSSLDDFKEKVREEFNIARMKEFITGNGPYWPDKNEIATWWLSKLDQAIQARNEELVELIKKELSIMETKEQDEGLLFDGDVGYVVGLNKAINLISPGRK